MKKQFLIASACLMACAFTNNAYAGSQLMPGISTGIPMGIPLPEGVYGISIPTYGTRDSSPELTVSGGAPMWLIWSTPITIGGGRLIFDTVTPYVKADFKNGPTISEFTNTSIDAQLKWSLGNDIYGGFQLGTWLPADNALSRDWTSYQIVGAITKLDAKSHYSATIAYGTGKDNGPNVAPDWINLDLTAIRKFDKWELGAVGFTSRDLGGPIATGTTGKQSQTAAGVLIGYNFGKFSTQLKYTQDITEKNYGGKDKRLWMNIVIPFHANK